MEEFIIKIGDFGFARKLDVNESADSWIGTPQNMAPEILFVSEQKSYNHKIDVWALGALFVHLLTGSPIFIGENDTTLESCLW